MKVIKVVIFFVFVLATKIVNAQTYVAIPDSNFVHYLKSIIPTAFKGDSLNKSSTLVTTSTLFITVPSKSIANLDGIQYFTSLNSLNCDGNQLTSLPALPNTLAYLTCMNNYITSLPVLPNKLIELACSNNHLSTTLPVLPDSLVYLDCNNCNLTSLPALPNSLKSLLCGNNQIACFPVFPSSIIDTSYFNIDPNPYNCLPNYVSAMNSMDLATPLCTAGNSNGCPVSVASIEQIKESNNQLLVYPNPASTKLNVTFIKNTESSNTIKLVNLTGQTVYSNIIGKIDVINISNFAKGVYMLIVTEGTKTEYKKIIVE